MHWLPQWMRQPEFINSDEIRQLPNVVAYFHGSEGESKGFRGACPGSTMLSLSQLEHSTL